MPGGRPPGCLGTHRNSPPAAQFLVERGCRRRKRERSGQIVTMSVERREPVKRSCPTIPNQSEKPAIVVWQTDPVRRLECRQLSF
jgi:hypothetical protein